MPRKKLIKINEVNSFPNVFNLSENPTEKDFRSYFNNENKIVLEIGCGHGDYTYNLAQHFPDKNFIGMDVKGSRIHAGASSVLENKINNAAFLVGRAEKLNQVFENKSISEILIPFPDPHVRRKSENRRLVSEYFLKIYKEILTDEGKIHFKTDNDLLFDFSVNVISRLNLKIHFLVYDLQINDDSDIYRSIQTRYEKHYRKDGRIIKYVCFGF